MGTLVRVELAKWQRNVVLKLCKRPGCPRKSSSGGRLHGEQAPSSPVGAWFVFGGDAGSYATRYLAGDAPIVEPEPSSWFVLTQHVDRWLSHVKQDIGTPDLWAQLRRERELLAGVSDEAIDNTPFTAAEQEEIAEQLYVLKDHLSREHLLSDEQARLLDERVAYLVDAAGRVGRKDWFLMAAGVMLSYVLAAALPPDSATHILGTLLTNIGHILWGGPRGLPSGGGFAGSRISGRLPPRMCVDTKTPVYRPCSLACR